MISSGALAVYHQRRNSWHGLFEQNFKYGRGRAQNILLLPSSASPLYFVPTGFLLYLIFAFYFPLPLFLYLCGALLFSARTFVKTKDWLACSYQPLVYFCTHIAYGAGFFYGNMEWFWRKGKLCEAA